MRIALNLLFLLPGVVGGTETYATTLVQELAKIDRTNEYLLFLNHESAGLPLEAGTNFQRIVSPVRATSRLARYAWEQLVLPLQLRRARIDILHSLGYVGPVLGNWPHIVTIHDLNYQDRAVNMSWHKRRVLGAFVRSMAAHAEHILTLSEFSRRQIIERLGVAPDKVTTSYLGSRHVPRDPEGTPQVVSGGVEVPYVLAFAGSSPHKNIPRLITAFSSIAGRIPHRLTIVGHLPRDGSIERAVEASGAAERITFAGYLDDVALARVLEQADALAFPSLYEGFGLPILDAQAVGVPVACSTTGAVPEVAGAGAVVFDPESADAMASALLRLLCDRSLHAAVVRAGYANVGRFSWESTARTALGMYERYGAHRSGS